MVVLKRCFIRPPHARDNNFRMIPRVVVLHRFDCIRLKIMWIYLHYFSLSSWQEGTRRGTDPIKLFVNLLNLYVDSSRKCSATLVPEPVSSIAKWMSLYGHLIKDRPTWNHLKPAIILENHLKLLTFKITREKFIEKKSK